MTNITYQTNEQLWKIESAAAAAGYKKTNDCYWVQIFESEETGEKFSTSREEESTNDPAADLDVILKKDTETETGNTMKNVYEIDTWRGNKEMNKIAIAAAKQHKGRKFTVAIGEWGATTFLVFAENKEEAKAIALEVYKGQSAGFHDEKIKVREVTNCKKYNKHPQSGPGG